MSVLYERLKQMHVDDKLVAMSMFATLPAYVQQVVRYHQEREEREVRERLNAEFMKELTAREEAIAESIVRAAQKPDSDESETLLREMANSVLSAALNSLPSANLQAQATHGRGALIISNEEIVKLAALPRAVRVERFKKWHRDDKCQREGCTKFVGNHSLKKFKEHYHIAVFNEPLEAQAEVLTLEFPKSFDAAEVDAHTGVWFDQYRIATKYVDGRIISFRLTFGFRIAIYERTGDEFVFMCEKVNEDVEAADSRIF